MPIHEIENVEIVRGDKLTDRHSLIWHVDGVRYHVFFRGDDPRNHERILYQQKPTGKARLDAFSERSRRMIERAIAKLKSS